MKKNIIIYIIPVILTACNFFENKQSEKVQAISYDSMVKLRTYIHDTILLNAQYRLKRGDTINVTAVLKRMYELDTNNVEYIIDLADGLIAAFNTKEALEFLDLALMKDKTYADKIYFSKSLAWSFALNKDSSYYYINKAIEIDSKGVRYLVHRSQKYEEDSLFSKALDDINEAIRRQPENKGLYVFRGIYQSRLGKYELALIDLKEIPSFMQKDANVYAHRALVYLNLKMYKECIKDCDMSLLLNPNNGHEYGVRANAKSNLQDFDGAYQDLKKAVELGDKEAIPLYEEYKKYYDTHKKI